MQGKGRQAPREALQALLEHRPPQALRRQAFLFTGVHSVLICHSLQIFSWHVLVVSGFSRWWQRYGWTVRVRLA